MTATVQTQIKKPGTTPGSSTNHAQKPVTSFSPLTLYQEFTSQEPQWSLSSTSSALDSSPSPLANHPSITHLNTAQTPAPFASIAPTTPIISVRIQSPAKPQTAKIIGEHDEAEREAHTVSPQTDQVPTTGASSSAPPPDSSNPPPQDGGQPLDTTTRSAMEPLFGHSFSHVRVHNDAQAAHATQSMQARAYTLGSHIFFNRGEYAPTMSQGRQLLAHELTHVVQQSRTNNATNRHQREEQEIQKASLAQHFAANNAFEREAHRTSAAVARGERVTVLERTDALLTQRAEQQTGNTDSGGVLDTLASWEAAGEAYLEKKLWSYVPSSLEPILRKGVFAWLEEHITAAIHGAFDTLMAPVRTVTGVVQELSTHFTELLIWMKGAAEQIRRGDCSAITEATHKIQQVIDGFASPIIDKVKELAGKVGSFFKDVWDQFGAPVWDWLKKVGGEAWQKIQEFAASVWEWTKPIRDLGERAWKWIKDKLGIGDGPDGQNGLLQWIEDKATEVWNKLKEKIEPIKKPLMVIGGILLLLSPAGPLIEFGAAVYGIIVGIRWIRQHLSTPDGVVNARVVLQKVIIPQILGAVKGFTGKLAQIASSITERLNGVMSGLGNLIGALGASVLSFAMSAIQWIADQFKALVEWANNKLNALVEWVTTGLERLHTFLQPVLDFLGKVASVIGDILQLPFLIAGKLWNMIPACIRDPFVNFLIQHILNHIPILKSIIAIPNIWEKLKAQAMTIIHQLFKQGDLMGALVSIFKLLLTVLKIPLELVTGIFTKAANAFDLIMKDPFAFLKNMLGAIKQGFMQFFGNIGKHLLDGVAEWLFDALGEGGIHVPRLPLSLGSIFSFVMEILDIREEKIWQKLQEKLSLTPAQLKWLRTVRKAIVGAWEWVTTLINEGPGGLWKHLTEKLSGLWHAFLNGVIDWVTTHIIQGAMQWLLGFLDPTGITEIIESIVTIYRSIQSAIQYAVKILRIIDTILDSIIGIAQGVLGPVATMLENALARGLPVVIGYLANLINLGDIAEYIQDIVGVVREKVDEGLDWLIDKAIATGKALLGALGLGKGKEEKKDEASKTMPSSANDLDEAVNIGAEKHTLRGHIENGHLTILIASNGFDDLSIRIGDIKVQYVENDLRSKNPEVQARGKKLSDRLDEVIGKGHDISIQLEKSTDEVAQREIIRHGLDELRTLLNDIGKDFNIRGLDYQKPTHHYVQYSLDGWWRATGAAGDPISRDSEGKGSDTSSSITPAGFGILGGYQRGHLLANALGGPGTEIANLVPISPSANTEMRDGPEKSARDIIYDLNADPPNILRYTVRCEYRNQSALDSWLVSTLGAAQGSANKLYTLARVGSGELLTNTNIATALSIPETTVVVHRENILEKLAFYFVPSAFIISMTILQKDKNKDVVVPAPERIDNPIP